MGLRLPNILFCGKIVTTQNNFFSFLLPPSVGAACFSCAVGMLATLFPGLDVR
jgi:hypothetical protein